MTKVYISTIFLLMLVLYPALAEEKPEKSARSALQADQLNFFFPFHDCIVATIRKVHHVQHGLSDCIFLTADITKVVRGKLRVGMAVFAIRGDYLTKDQIGSVRDVTNSSGGLESAALYSQFGESVITGSGQKSDFGYAAYYLHSRSQTQLTIFRAYNSHLGRWLSRDLQGERAGLNLYQYAANNPITMMDPLGLDAVEAITPGAGTTAVQTYTKGMAKNVDLKNKEQWMGCRSVVSIYMGLPPTAFPEEHHPGYYTKCYPAKEKNGTDAYNKASCHPCPQQYGYFSLWCKQGTFTGSPALNSDGSLANAAGIWDGGAQFNYFIHVPTGGFAGGDSDRCPPKVYPDFPANDYPNMMCCKTCR